MQKKNIHFETLGCKLNQVESEGAARVFVDAGFSVTMEPFTAATKVADDVVACVINTCTVTAKAEQKARRIIRLLLTKCPNAVVVVTGCYAQLDRDEILALGDRIVVLGGQNKGTLADMPSVLNQNPETFGVELKNVLQDFFDSKKKLTKINEISEPFRLSTDTFINHSRSSLKIQDGCNCVCTYCRIRLARGKSVSLDAASVIERVKALENAGQKEVVITTVNIAQYRGKWQDGTVNFAGLLRLILENTNSIGIRISSLYPEIVDEELGEIVSNPRVRPHFHISVQSGSDAVLAKMKRPYKIEAVYKAVKILKKAKQNPFLACDIIAGFPGETDDDFALTMKMLEECGFAFVHAFPFSARPGTEAFSMRPMVPNYITDKRISALEEYNKKSKSEYINSFVGKTLPAVCETIHRARAALMRDRIVVHAVTENFLHCQLVFATDEKNVPEAGSEIELKVLRPLSDSERTGESDTFAQFLKKL
ncbi:tRNA (N(6)-L-threonylcarbamoyladenosine(37)-C(2))-methylthiotransferase MtaB [Treponema zioleckii]|uniref:tRNA (N(6)-L-threonylcarbamoyladenosine(37)-C(2))- methylthiotransferase MtaB n=1 Tax=Treponema zioleckii TaxID=331680 RepID=UPI00168B0EB2|nr:tRNA (N(6)-L-threonylcarbamoyladenosine(37)-C(2))-methylthiotransferase MtaB [Treponema zioleckii]